MSVSNFNPAVDILIPTYKRPELLTRAVASCLAQKYKNIRIVISDNASGDSTDRIGTGLANLYPEKVVYSSNKENLGMTGNWIKLLRELSSADYCLLLSDDDYLIDSNFIEESINKINSYRVRGQNISLAFGNVILVAEKSSPKSTKACRFNWPEFIDSEVLLKKWRIKSKHTFNHIPLCGCIFSREIAISCNPFNSNMPSSDFELWWKMILSGNPGIFIKSYSSAYVVHGANEADRHNYNLKDWIYNYRSLINPFNDFIKNKKTRNKILDLFRFRRILAGSLIDNTGIELNINFWSFFYRIYLYDKEVTRYLIFTFIFAPKIWIYILIRPIVRKIKRKLIKIY